MTNATLGRFALLKALVVTAVTLLGLGISLANAQTPSRSAAPQQSPANQYYGLNGGGG
jgi:hypothetical protein